MLISELAIKGVRDFASPLSRLTFAPGLNVFWTPDAAARRRVIDILYHTLHPSASRHDMTMEHVDPDAADARSALSFSCKPGETFRLVRDLRSGAGSLYRGDEHGQFSLVTREPMEIVRCMRMHDSIPEAVAYERCLMLNADSMPSLGAAAARRSGAPWNDSGSVAPVAPGMSGNVSSPQLGVSLYKHAPRPFAQLDVASSASGSGASAPTEPPESAPPLRTVVGDRAGSASLSGSAPPVEPASGGLDPTIQAAPPQAPSEQWYAENTGEKLAVFQRLTVALDTVNSANAAGNELDELLARRAQITPKLEIVTRHQGIIEQLERALAADSDLEALPSDAEERLRGYEDAEQRYEASTRRLLGEQDNVEADYHQASVTPLTSDPYFIGGGAVVVLSIVVAIVLEIPQIALANLLGALVAGGAAWRFVAELEMKARLQARVDAVQAAMARVEKHHLLETSVTKKIIEQFPLGTEEILSRLEESRVRQRQLQEAKVLLKEALEALEDTGGLEEADRLDSRIERLEGVCAMGATSPAAGMQYESSRIRHEQLGRELAARGLLPKASASSPASASHDDEPGYGSGYGAGSGLGSGGGAGNSGPRGLGLGAEGWLASPPGDPGDPTSSHSGMSPYSAGAEPEPELGDRSCAVIQSAADELFLSRDELTAQIRPRLERYVTALTNGAYQHVLFGPGGRIAVSPGRDVQATPYTLLKGEVLDLVDAALRLTVAEVIAQEIQVPILIDDPFIHLDVARRYAFVQALGFLSELTQVVVTTSASDIDGAPISMTS